MMRRLLLKRHCNNNSDSHSNKTGISSIVPNMQTNHVTSTLLSPICSSRGDSDMASSADLHSTNKLIASKYKAPSCNMSRILRILVYMFVFVGFSIVVVFYSSTHPSSLSYWYSPQQETQHQLEHHHQQQQQGEEEPKGHVHQQPKRFMSVSYTDFTYPSIFPNQTQHLLDFAVAGFAKCGTTFLMRDVLGSSNSIYMGYSNTRGQYKEMHQLENIGQLPEFLSYFEPPLFDSSHVANANVRRGFKAPNTLMFDESMIHLSLYFPQIKFIVSVRHPILWFQSNYNYKMRLPKYAQDYNITPFNRVGECKGGISSKESTCSLRKTCVLHKPGFGCTDLSNFHIHLARLGWTPRSSTRELSLLHHRVVDTSSSTFPLFNFTQSSMFFMELNQLDPRKNKTLTDTLISDLELFLNLQPGKDASDWIQEYFYPLHMYMFPIRNI